MANRNYNPVRGPGYEITNLAGGFLPIGGAGALVNIDDATWFTAVASGVGLYTLTLSDLFVACYSASFQVSKVAAGTPFRCELNLPTGVSLNSLVSTTGVIPLITTDLITGLAGHPPNDAASVIYFNLVMRNSSVTG